MLSLVLFWTLQIFHIKNAFSQRKSILEEVVCHRFSIPLCSEAPVGTSGLILRPEGTAFNFALQNYNFILMYANLFAKFIGNVIEAGVLSVRRGGGVSF